MRRSLILLFLVTGCHAPLPEPPQYPMTGEAPAVDRLGATDIAADLQVEPMALPDAPTCSQAS